MPWERFDNGYRMNGHIKSIKQLSNFARKTIKEQVLVAYSDGLRKRDLFRQHKTQKVMTGFQTTINIDSKAKH